MCGIAGFFTTTTKELETPLALMQRALVHRGPDDRGLYLSADQRIGLTHTRLSIIDLSPAGHQPMATADGRYVITFNGEIYNYRELRRELEQAGQELVSQTDTEVILHLYARHGADCLQRLRGMFAFAIWDVERRELFVARDRLGIKPLYYAQRDGLFLFASEVRALLASGLIERRLDHAALADYLLYQSIPAPRTLIAGVKSLLPGCWLRVDATGRVTTGEYWNLLENRDQSAAHATRSEALQRVRELFFESVDLHMVSDVPVGVFLSGGIDSSAIVAAMHELGYRPKSFSIVFDEAGFDEAPYARRVAQLFQSDHCEIRLTEQSMLDLLHDSLGAMDQPTGDGINSFIVSKAVRDAGITVALSGLGGDEIFAGYSSFERLERAAKYLKHTAVLSPALKARAAKLVRLSGRSSIASTKLAAMLESDGTLAALYPVTRRVLSLEQRGALLQRELMPAGASAPDPYEPLLRAAFAGHASAGVLSQVSFAESRTYMHDVLLRDTDQMSMAHALEIRVPLLDHKLLEYVMGLPDDFKRNNGTPKPLLVNCLQGMLPREIVNRPKQGFTLPFAHWMLGALREFCEERLSPERVSARGLFNVNEVQRLWQDFVSGSPSVSWSRLWVLVVLEEWLEQNHISCTW